MAESTIITGQFVRISQTPASIGGTTVGISYRLFPNRNLRIFYCHPLNRTAVAFGIYPHFLSLRYLFTDTRLFFSLRDIQPRAEFRQAYNEYPCCQSRRYHPQYQLLPVALAAFSYWRSNYGRFRHSGGPVDKKQSTNRGSCCRNNGD